MKPMLPSLTKLSVDVPSDVVREIAHHHNVTMELNMFIQVRQNYDDEKYDANVRIKLVNPDTHRDWYSKFGMFVNKHLGEQNPNVHNTLAKAFVKGWSGVEGDFKRRTDVELYPRDIRLGLADDDNGIFTGELYFSLYSKTTQIDSLQSMMAVAKSCTDSFLKGMRLYEPPFVTTTPVVDEEEHITSTNREKMTLERTCLIHLTDIDSLMRYFLEQYDPPL